MRGVVVGISVALLLAVAPASALVKPKPTLRLLSSSTATKVVVRATGFQAKERVTVRAVGRTTTSKVVWANASGVFVATLDRPLPLSCGRFVVRAIGAKGTTIVLRNGPLECNPPGDSSTG
jgi:hypothetical protein